jgi:hypothetical protein
VLVSIRLAYATASYILAPVERWQTEFSETFLPMQVEALKSLQAGNSENAKKYLEAVSAITLKDYAQQRSKETKAPMRFEIKQAVAFLCSSAASAASSTAGGEKSLEKSCTALRTTAQ